MTGAADGTYTLTGLPFGDNALRVAAPPGWQQSMPRFNASHTAAVSATAPLAAGLDFGLGSPLPGVIGGTVFEDKNGDGYWANMSGTEPALAGFTVYDDVNGNGRVKKRDITD